MPRSPGSSPPIRASARCWRAPGGRRCGGEPDGFAGLASIVVSQQVSTASAKAIWGRLTEALDPLDHAAVLRARPARLARAGLSAPKIRTLKALAKAIDRGHVDLPALVDKSADEAHAALTSLHGIGPWTADIYLLFCLGHADAWPAGDLALQEATKLLLALKTRPTTKDMGPLAEAWRPWRGAAACLLWTYYRAHKQRDGAPIAANGNHAEVMMAAELDGPRLEPRSGAARQLVVFLHGYGADGNDLIEIGRAWQGLLPQAAFVSPHAPEPCGQAPVGRQWFSLTFRDPNERWVGANQAAPVLQGFLDAELARRQLPASALALVGFSQGTMMALHVGLRRATPPLAIVGYSGLLVVPPDANPDTLAAEIKSRPPVLLIHGDQDDLIPAQALFHASSGLASLGVPVEWHMSHGIGHGIDQEGLRHGGEFLARRFAAAR